MTVTTRGRAPDLVKLDLFQKITNINWADAKDIAVMWITWTRRQDFGIPGPFSVKTPPINTGFNPFSGVVNFGGPPLSASQVSPAMFAKATVWSRAPYTTKDFQRSGSVLVFFNLGAIKRKLASPKPATWTFTVRTPASAPKKTAGSLVWVVFNNVVYASAAAAIEAFQNGNVDALYAFPKSAPRLINGVLYYFRIDPVTGALIPFIGDVYFTETEAEAVAAFYAAHQVAVVGSVEASGDTFDNLTWLVDVASYRKKKEFPSVPDGPSWDYNNSLGQEPLFKSFTRQRGTMLGPIETASLPAKTVSITINLKTLELTSTAV